MTRLISALVLTGAFAAAVPAQAYQPNPFEDGAHPKRPFLCPGCPPFGIKPGDRLINPGVKRGFVSKGDRVGLYPWPDLPTGLRKFAQ